MVLAAGVDKQQHMVEQCIVSRGYEGSGLGHEAWSYVGQRYVSFHFAPAIS